MSSYLITGGAGFIGSNLAHALSEAGEAVRVLDDFSSGHRRNLAGLEGRIEIMEGSVCDVALLAQAMRGMDFCLHQAAIPSVPRSLAAPAATNRANVEGSLNVFLAARAEGVKRVVYASSSSVYGDAAVYPLCEDLPRAPISPYAVSKAAAEMYAAVFAALEGQELVGLRYFNVFGPRQDPASAYAAAIPSFMLRLARGEAPVVYGDGLQARDFTYVENVVRANLLACQAPGPVSGVYNIACGAPVTVLSVAQRLAELMGRSIAPEHRPARPGDIRQSWADISRARQVLGYAPGVDFEEGLARTVRCFSGKEDSPWLA